MERKIEKEIPEKGTPGKIRKKVIPEEKESQERKSRERERERFKRKIIS